MTEYYVNGTDIAPIRHSHSGRMYQSFMGTDEEDGDKSSFGSLRLDSKMVRYLENSEKEILGRNHAFSRVVGNDAYMRASFVFLYKTLRAIGASDDLALALVKDNLLFHDFYPGMRGQENAVELYRLQQKTECGPAEALLTRTAERLNGAYLSNIDRGKLNGLELLAREEKLANRFAVEKRKYFKSSQRKKEKKFAA